MHFTRYVWTYLVLNEQRFTRSAKFKPVKQEVSRTSDNYGECSLFYTQKLNYKL